MTSRYERPWKGAGLPTFSESESLTHVIELLKQVSQQPDVGAAMPYLREAMAGLSALRAQATRGIHKNPAVEGETAAEHIRNAYSILQLTANIQGGWVSFRDSDYSAALTRLEYALADLERWRGGNAPARANPYKARCLIPSVTRHARGVRRWKKGTRGRGLLRTSPGRGILRRRNSPLVVMGGNPPADAIEATWARLEYRRPDDPEGKKIVREHDFENGFIAEPMADGSILLRHPDGKRLWTQR